MSLFPAEPLKICCGSRHCGVIGAVYETDESVEASVDPVPSVEGSVRRSGNQLRVTAQLIKAEDGFHLCLKPLIAPTAIRLQSRTR